MQFTIAINYGGRDEITRAVRKLATKVSNHELAPEDITEEMISKNLDTWELPDPDLLIRTSGAVSYTHLDVYKRQGRGRPKPLT